MGEETLDYLGRWFLFRLGKYFGVFLHRFHASDPEGLHDHPWPWGRLILKRGYWEHHHDGTSTWCGPGSITLWRSARELHRAVLETPRHRHAGVWTLFWHWKRHRDWGWLEADGTWVKSQNYGKMHPLKGVFFPHADDMKQD